MILRMKSDIRATSLPKRDDAVAFNTLNLSGLASAWPEFPDYKAQNRRHTVISPDSVQGKTDVYLILIIESQLGSTGIMIRMVPGSTLEDTNTE